MLRIPPRIAGLWFDLFTTPASSLSAVATESQPPSLSLPADTQTTVLDSAMASQQRALLQGDRLAKELAAQQARAAARAYVTDKGRRLWNIGILCNIVRASLPYPHVKRAATCSAWS